MSFGTSEDGTPGWKDGADTVHPFNSALLHSKLVDSQVLYTDGHGKNDFYYSPTEEGVYTVIVFASGNAPNAAIYLNDSDISNTFLNVSGAAHCIILSVHLKTTDVLHMLIRNAGGAGYSRRYWIYK